MKINAGVKRVRVVRDVLESYRELPAYKIALVDIYTTNRYSYCLCGTQRHIRRNRLVDGI
jgi:hypothetical protein